MYASTIKPIEHLPNTWKANNDPISPLSAKLMQKYPYSGQKKLQLRTNPHRNQYLLLGRLIRPNPWSKSSNPDPTSSTFSNLFGSRSFLPKPLRRSSYASFCFCFDPEPSKTHRSSPNPRYSALAPHRKYHNRKPTYRKQATTLLWPWPRWPTKNRIEIDRWRWLSTTIWWRGEERIRVVQSGVPRRSCGSVGTGLRGGHWGRFGLGFVSEIGR